MLRKKPPKYVYGNEDLSTYDLDMDSHKPEDEEDGDLIG